VIYIAMSTLMGNTSYLNREKTERVDRVVKYFLEKLEEVFRSNNLPSLVEDPWGRKVEREQWEMEEGWVRAIQVAEQLNW
jgi:hypothetical protein